jgi:ABC-2 type transport system ATP-binding protein/lipopolysaccharide transport system ATP-binding protein
MASIELENIGVDFALYHGSSRSLKKSVLRNTVGGLIGNRERDDRTIVRALNEISLSVKNGDRLALIGQNGAGKSTLLRVLAGIYRPTSGKISVEGRRVPLFDITLGADEEATGRENIVLRGLLMGLTRAEIDERIDEIGEFSELGDFLDLPTKTYSTGMMLRLLFSIATSLGSEILLMDEWIVAGDEKFLARAHQRLHGLVERSSILILASHSSGLLRSVCNRAILLEAGGIAASGTVDEILDQYRR